METDPRLTRKQDNGSTFGFWGAARVVSTAFRLAGAMSWIPPSSLTRSRILAVGSLHLSRPTAQGPQLMPARTTLEMKGADR